jgi:hypothetical protein
LKKSVMQYDWEGDPIGNKDVDVLTISWGHWFQ